MEFINLTERAGVPRTTNSVVANDPGAVCVAGAGESAGVDATLRRLPLCVHASACLLPATVVTLPPGEKKNVFQRIYTLENIFRI